MFSSYDKYLIARIVIVVFYEVVVIYHVIAIAIEK